MVGILPVAISLLVCFSFALPLWLSGYLFARRNSLKSPATRQTIGWLYSRYHEGSEWWEVFEVFRKMILTGMLVYLPAPTRAPVALLICIVRIFACDSPSLSFSPAFAVLLL